MTRHRVRAGYCLLLVALLLSLLPGVQPQTPVVEAGEPDSGDSLQVTVYDAAFPRITLKKVIDIHNFDLNDGLAGLNYDQRAAAIANRIKHGSNQSSAHPDDVVVLNGVFADSAKDILVNELKTVYPYYVKRIRGPVVNKGPDLYWVLATICAILSYTTGTCPSWLFVFDPALNDSGLMLFSRYPFAKFDIQSTHSEFFNKDTFSAPVDVSSQPTYEGKLNGADLTQPYVSVFIFDDANTTLPQSQGPMLGYAFSEGYFDSLQSKAAGMVRIKKNGKIHNVAFSNLQSGSIEFPANPINRERQLSDIREFILKNLTASQLKTQPLYLLGNLNIDGAPRLDSKEWKATFSQTAAAKGFFACKGLNCSYNPDTKAGKTFMTDGWGYEMPTQDFGYDASMNNARTTYMLHNPLGGARMCVQRLWYPGNYMTNTDYGMETTEQAQLSSNLPLRVNINRVAPYCSPRDDSGANGPFAVSFKPNGSADLLVGSQQKAKISYPGSMQWYRIDKPGSYGIQVSSGDSKPGDVPVGFEVYAASNMSTPIKPYYGEVSARYGQKFALPNPPYYVRVFALDVTNHAGGTIKSESRTKTGNYRIKFHEFRGTSPEDAIILLGGVRTRYEWPSNYNGVNPKQTWFEFYTNKADSGHFPSVSVRVENLAFVNGELNPQAQEGIKQLTINSDQAPSYPVLFPSNAVPRKPYFELLPSGDYSQVQTGWEQEAPKLPNFVVGGANKARRYYATIKRTPVDDFVSPFDLDDPVETYLTFRTDLTYFYPLSVIRKKGWDSAKIRLSFDGPKPILDPDGKPKQEQKVANLLGAHSVSFGSLGNKETLMLYGEANYPDNAPRSYIDKVLPLLDHDTLAEPSKMVMDGQAYYMIWQSIDGLSPDYWGGDMPNPYGAGWWDGYLWHDRGNINDSHYWYQLIYYRSHEDLYYKPGA